LRETHFASLPLAVRPRRDQLIIKRSLADQERDTSRHGESGTPWGTQTPPLVSGEDNAQSDQAALKAYVDKKHRIIDN